MILKIFNGRNDALQYLIISLYFILVYLVPVTIAESIGFNPLYDILISLINGNEILIRLVFITITLSPIILTYFFLEHLGVIDRNNKLFVFIAPLFIFSKQAAWVISPPLVSLLFFIIATSFIFRTTEDDKSIAKLFSATLLFSLASLFYSVGIYSVVILIVALGIFKQINVRDVLAIIVSFTIPYVYLFSYFYLTDSFYENWNIFTNQFSNIGLQLYLYKYSFETVFEIVLIIVSVFVVANVLLNQRNSLIQVRKYISFIFWSLIGSFLLLFVSGNNIEYHFIIILFLVSIFFSIYIGSIKKLWFFEAIILFFLLHSIYLIWSFI